MTSAAPPMVCARCSRVLKWKAPHHWPEGHICVTCHTWALETYGICAGCGVHRMTPGIAADGGRLCTGCAGMPGRSYFCLRCGDEGRRHREGVCARCVLTDHLNELLDDGSGRVRAELLPLFEALRSMVRPRSGLTWINKAHVQTMLRSLARGDVELSHDGLDQLTPWRSVAYLRDLLMDNGVLPAADRQLILFQRWLREWLATITDTEQRRLLERFATWHTLHKLRATAARHPLSPGSTATARDGLRQSAKFLLWLADRGRTIGQCRQADLDAWYGTPEISRRTTNAFLHWCVTNRTLTRLRIPYQRTENPAPISQNRRIALIRRAVTDDAVPLRARVVTLLMLLYAQPVSRIMRLTTDDVIHDGDQVLLRLGTPPSPVPEPFASLLLKHVASRENTTTATNPNGAWLFPGRRAGQPLHPATLGKQLATLEITTLHARTATIRQLVLQAPPSIVAGMLGYHVVHTEAVAVQAGGTWKHYAPGDHTRSLPRIPKPRTPTT